MTDMVEEMGGEVANGKVEEGKEEIEVMGRKGRAGGRE